MDVETLEKTVAGEQFEQNGSDGPDVDAEAVPPFGREELLGRACEASGVVFGQDSSGFDFSEGGAGAGELRRGERCGLTRCFRSR